MTRRSRPPLHVVVSLPGFNSVKREGIQLTAGFTAADNADMQPDPARRN